MFFDKTQMVLTDDGAYLIKPKTVTGSPGFYQELTAEVVPPPPDVGKAWPGGKPKRKTYGIKRVIFNDPATVVYWVDGTKTVVKCQPGDVYSKETGLALCIAKKFLGNTGNFNDVFKQWIPEEDEPVEDEIEVEDKETGAINLLRSGDIRIGDKVRVVNYGQTYSEYKDWIEDHVKDPADAAKWVYGALMQNGDIGVVKYLAPHERAKEGNIAYIEIGGTCYMVHVNGLEKV